MMVEITEMKPIVSKSVKAQSQISPSHGLRELAELLGVECEYVDGREHVHHTIDETLRIVLRALGVDIQSESDIQRELERIQEERWTTIIEPVQLLYPERRTPLFFLIAFQLDEASLDTVLLEYQLKDEQGRIRLYTVKGSSCVLLEESVVKGVRYVRIQASLPGRLQLGYYDLALKIGIGTHVLEARSLVIAAPQRCYLPSALKREWGIGVQLYNIRSQQNWGIGDFRDLERIMKTAGKAWKASCIGLQPLHSMTPGLVSPYSPSSRLSWNPLYLNVEQVAEFRSSSKLQRMFRGRKFQATLQHLRSTRLIDYEGVSNLKLPILEDLFCIFKRQHLHSPTSRGRTFLRFVRQSPQSMNRFCTFQALSEYFQGAIWREWPSE
jgi:hypothetical protein